MQDFTKVATTRESNPLSKISPKKGPEKWLNKRPDMEFSILVWHVGWIFNSNCYCWG